MPKKKTEYKITNRNNAVTNSIKTLKMVHIKKKKKGPHQKKILKKKVSPKYDLLRGSPQSRWLKWMDKCGTY